MGLLILRVPLGLTLAFHGSQKVFAGAFGGVGYAATVASMTSKGIPAPLVYLAIAAEFLGGLGVLFGLLTPIAAFGIFATMAFAVEKAGSTPGVLKALTDSGDLAAATVVLYPLILAMVALAITVMGAGQYSLDARLFKRKGKSS